MALFKILKGDSNNLPTKHTEGYCYFTEDEHKFYIDVNDSTRVPLNAEDATTLLEKTIINEISENNKDNIPNGEAIINYINDNHYIVHLTGKYYFSQQKFTTYTFEDKQIAKMLNNENAHIQIWVDENQYKDNISEMFFLKKSLQEGIQDISSVNENRFTLRLISSITNNIHLIFECYNK